MLYNSNIPIHLFLHSFLKLTEHHTKSECCIYSSQFNIPKKEESLTLLGCWASKL